MPPSLENGVLKNIRTAELTTSSPVDVRDTSQLSGLAKDSLSGTNTMQQYTNGGGSKDKGPFGGMAEYK